MGIVRAHPPAGSLRPESRCPRWPSRGLPRVLRPPSRLPHPCGVSVPALRLRGVGVTVKRCTGRCRRERPLVAFPRDRTKADGRGSRCRECVAADRRDRRRDLRGQRIAAALAADDPGRRRLAAAAGDLFRPAPDPQAPARAARIVALADDALRARSGPLPAAEPPPRPDAPDKGSGRETGCE